MIWVYKRKQTICILFAVLGLVFCLGARTFAAEGDTEAGALQLKPMVVTAEKRAEDVQEIPSSITAITESQIQDSGISSLQDFSHQVPNLFISNWGFRGNSFVFIRGIGAINNDPAVGFYVDDVNYMDSRVFDSNLFDIERIEVLRGPQGSLYGRNSLGGVINIITKKPDNDFHVGGDLNFGNYGLMETNVYMRGPVIEDELFLGVSANLEKMNGYNHNDYLDEYGDERDDKSGRAQLRWTPNDRLDVLVSVDGEQIDDGAFPITSLSEVENNPHHYSHNLKSEHQRNSVGSSLKVGYDADAMGITSITGFRHFDDRAFNDQDFSAANLSSSSERIHDDQFSQEFRFASPEDNGDWKWLGGLYAFKEKKDYSLQMFYSAAVAGTDSLTSSTSDLNKYGYAAFGQATYTMFDKLDVTGGLRYDYEHASIDFERVTTPGPVFSPDLAFSDDTDCSSFLPKFQLAYRWTDEAMTYVGASRGYRSGGFNTGFSDMSDASFDSEYSWNYELGAKTTWFDNRVSLNGAVFYIDLDDQQITQMVPNDTVIRNAGKSRSMGFEIESTARLTETVTAEAGFGYTDAEFTQYEDAMSGIDYKGNKVPFAPEYTCNLALQWRIPLMASFGEGKGPLNFFARGEVQGIGDFYWDTANKLKEDAHELFNMRLGVESDNFDLTFWVKNMFDKKYRSVAFDFPMLGAQGQAGTPRTFGMTLSARF